ncbi:hypothetical protein C1I63_18150 [Rathayibacter caricis DSM 15933]|uniref:Uncharacterized protein n=1 Tax=Rathayibacter caricis DSM 15933 TaxID=1328867 RepID=A0A2T4UNR6_9MICO|nr:hypothetical protein C1I63_18150 [Rathayibacter caricis DSM 15933]
MSVITAAHGDVPSRELGYTSMHEHLAANLSLMGAVLARYGAQQAPASMLTLTPEKFALLRDGAAIFWSECSRWGTSTPRPSSAS